MASVIILSGRVPGLFLTLLNNVIEKAIQEQLNLINAEFVKKVFQIRTPKEPGGEDSTGPLAPTHVNLLEDETK